MSSWFYTMFLSPGRGDWDKMPDYPGAPSFVVPVIFVKFLERFLYIAKFYNDPG